MRLWLLPLSIISLSLVSLLTIKSVAPSLASPQLVFFLLGITLFWGISRISFLVLQQWSGLAYVVLCVLLIIPLLIGKTTRGIAGWIDIGTFFSIQPSQLALPIVALLLADLIHKSKTFNLKTIATLLAWVGIPSVLIIVEPDLGTTLLYLMTLGTILFLSPIPGRYIFLGFGLAVITALIGWNAFLKPYQKERITSFISANQEVQGSGYNARQSLIAVGSGQLWGRGVGQGVQSHLKFLPERQTDFIFASLAEEWGFIGSTVVIAMYAILAFFCFYIATRSSHPAAKSYCIAAGLFLTYQSTINIGMNMGLFPITGVTLPLLSYGGSSILATCLLLGVVQSVSQDLPPKTAIHVT